MIGRLFENRSLREHMRAALTDEGEREARARIEATVASGAVRNLDERDVAHYGRPGDVTRRLGTLKAEVERERYLHLLPANVRRLIELACPVLGLSVRGDLDGSFALAPARPGALDPLLEALESYPEEARERLLVRRPSEGDRRPGVWLHPGEPVFDALCERVLAVCSEDAGRGAIFTDLRASEPYWVHLGDVEVCEEPAEGAGRGERKTLERRLVAMRQGEDGKVRSERLERFALLRPAPEVPPGAIPLAARAAHFRARAGAHLEEEGRRMADERRNVVRAELPERRDRVNQNFNLRAAEAARRRTERAPERRSRPDHRAPKGPGPGRRARSGTARWPEEGADTVPARPPP